MFAPCRRLSAVRPIFVPMGLLRPDGYRCRIMSLFGLCDSNQVAGDVAIQI